MSIVPIQSSYCLSQGQTWDIKGNFYAQDFHYISIKFTMCKNDTRKVCKSPSEINDFLSKV